MHLILLPPDPLPDPTTSRSVYIHSAAYPQSILTPPPPPPSPKHRHVHHHHFSTPVDRTPLNILRLRHASCYLIPSRASLYQPALLLGSTCLLRCPARPRTPSTMSSSAAAKPWVFSDRPRQQSLVHLMLAVGVLCVVVVVGENVANVGAILGGGGGGRGGAGGRMGYPPAGRS